MKNRHKTVIDNDFLLEAPYLKIDKAIILRYCTRSELRQEVFN
jgi:hypothetical protein